jgi:hypothetical protein
LNDEDDRPSATIFNRIGDHLREIQSLITKFGNQKYREGLLKSIDKANGGSTSYGTSVKATKQVIDTVVVSTALNNYLILFEPITWSVSGTYSIELPVGTYKITAVSGKGGNGGGAGYEVTSGKANGSNASGTSGGSLGHDGSQGSQGSGGGGAAGIMEEVVVLSREVP